MTMGSNWIELGLSKDEEALVQLGASLYKTIHLDTIDNIFVIARAIATLQGHHFSSGTQGGFGDALVQYGFVARDGGPMNKAVRSHLKTLLDNEESVRAWWGDGADEEASARLALSECDSQTLVCLTAAARAAPRANAAPA